MLVSAMLVERICKGMFVTVNRSTGPMTTEMDKRKVYEAYYFSNASRWVF